MTLRELILDSLRLIGVIEVGQGASADEDVEDLRTVNAMLNSWRTERLMAYTITTTPYTINSAGTISVPRPVRIEDVWIVQGTEHLWVDQLSNQFRYRGGVFSDGVFPTSILTFNPPPASGTVVMIQTWVTLPSFVALTDVVSLPDGYLECAQYNLALRLAPRYKDAMVSPLVLQMARDSKADVKRMNAQPPVLGMDEGLLDCGRDRNGFSGGFGPSVSGGSSGGGTWNGGDGTWNGS